MKTVAKIFLILFIAFLTTPTIVTVIEKSSDISVFFNMTEEEHFHKEIIAAVSLEHFLLAHTISEASSTIILSEKLSKHDKITASIFIPPPNAL
ncbi:hypothetical protein [Flavobacterium sp.]|uniref:hypothetical protein n=1 Tax=Flavobacterium sp. XS2P14 TaxID=3401735 RepID=UPI00286A6A5D|nr:hypothetical protein [Flavobacterium sp.]